MSEKLTKRPVEPVEPHPLEGGGEPVFSAHASQRGPRHCMPRPDVSCCDGETAEHGTAGVKESLTAGPDHKGDAVKARHDEWLEAYRRHELDSSPTASARKDDAAKARHDLIAPEFIDGLAAVLTHGADKYGARNWEKGMAWGRCFAAAMRHLWAWWRGEAKDAETGLSHLLHAACCLMFLSAYEVRGAGEDDRPGQKGGGA